MVREMSELCFFVPSPRRDKKGRPLGMDGMNEIVAQARGNRFAAAKAKKAATEHVAGFALAAAREQHWTMPEGRCYVLLTFVEPSSKRDPDNIFAGAKPILDGLTARGGLGAGIIADDSQARIDLHCSLAHRIDKEHPGVWVRIKEE